MITNVTLKVTTAPLVHASQRKGIIGGSQIGTLVKDAEGNPLAGCYSSEYQTYRSYIGVEENPDDSAKESFYAGNRLEDAIAKWFSYDMQLHNPTVGGETVDEDVHELDFQYVDPDENRLVLHPDREFSVGGKRYALECKTASAFAMRGSKWPELETIDRSKIPAWVPEKLEDGRPLVIYDGAKSVMPGYYVQCLWYYALAGYDGVFLARMTDNRLFIYFVEANVVFEKMLYKTARTWLDKVDKGYIPAPSTFDEAKDKYPLHTKGKIFVADSKLEARLAEYKILSDKKADVEKAIDTCKAAIVDTIGDAEIVKSTDGTKLATCKNGTQTRLDSALLRDKEPAIYEKYTVTKETARILKVS